jgi:hypothetical protein
MTLSPGKIINLIAAILGAAGAIVLFKGSFAYESLAGYVLPGPGDVTQASERNKRRGWFQSIGLTLILISFVLQGLAQFVE